MGNINIDTFSEQLGIYDFFNVIVSGAIMGMLWYFIWPGFFEKTLFKIKVHISVVIIFTIILCYFTGMIIQEVGSIADRYVFHVKDKMRTTFLECREDNEVLTSSVRLNMCRKYAREILKESEIEYRGFFSKEETQYVCARMEYRISYIGKSGKMEKLRALFSMARSMVICMIFSIILLLYTEFVIQESHLWDISSGIWMVFLGICGLIFYYRMKKTMRYMLLIMIGNYEADYYNRNRVENEKCKWMKKVK